MAARRLSAALIAPATAQAAPEETALEEVQPQAAGLEPEAGEPTPAGPAGSDE